MRTSLSKCYQKTYSYLFRSAYVSSSGPIVSSILISFCLNSSKAPMDVRTLSRSSRGRESLFPMLSTKSNISCNKATVLDHKKCNQIARSFLKYRIKKVISLDFTILFQFDYKLPYYHCHSILQQSWTKGSLKLKIVWRTQFFDGVRKW